MKNISYILILLLSFSIWSCNEEKDHVAEEKTVVKEVVEEKAAIIYEGIPQELAQKLFNEANALEGSFYDSGMSFNLWDDNVKGVINMMLNVPPTFVENKQLSGHVVLQKKTATSADNIAFVEVYFDGAKTYVIFKIDEKKYYNTLTEKGIEFFTKMATPQAQ